MNKKFTESINQTVARYHLRTLPQVLEYMRRDLADTLHFECARHLELPHNIEFASLLLDKLRDGNTSVDVEQLFRNLSRTDNNDTWVFERIERSFREFNHAAYEAIILDLEIKNMRLFDETIRLFTPE